MEYDDRERRTWLVGGAVAVIAGLVMGAAMKPDFGDDRVLGPQVFSADGGVHETSYRPDPGVSVYAGKIPDYVIGTDWTRPRREAAYEAPAPLPADESASFTADEEPASPMVMTYRTWREAPREASSYPSVDGDMRYRSEGWGDERDRRGEAEEDPPA